MITIQKSGAQRLFDHPVFLGRNQFKYVIIIIIKIIIIIIIVTVNETWMNVKQTFHEKTWHRNTR